MQSSGASRLKHGTRPLGWVKWHWMLPLVFVVGYAISYRAFSELWQGYLALNICAALACVVLLTRLKGTINRTLPYWVLLVVFLLAYFVKFYWITVDPVLIEEGVFVRIGLIQPHDEYRAFASGVYAFLAFCGTAWVLLSGRRPLTRNAPSNPPATNSGAVGMLPIGIVMIMTVITTYVIATKGISIMGVESVALPFHLAGIIFYIRTVVIPALFLLKIWSCQRSGVPTAAWFYVGLMFVYGLSDMLLRSSRGAFVGLVLLWWFLSLTAGSYLPRKAYLLLATLAALVFIFQPFVGEFRNLRIDSGSGDYVALLKETESNLIGGNLGNLGAILQRGFGASLNRLTGVEMLIAFHAESAGPLGRDLLPVLSGSSVGEYVTREIFGYTNNTTNAIAPGLVGWFYLVGGDRLVVPGLIAFTLVTAFCWGLLRRLRLQTLPVAQALLAFLLLTTAVDGGLDSLASLTTLSWPAAIFLCEYLFRVNRRQRSLTGKRSVRAALPTQHRAGI